MYLIALICTLEPKLPQHSVNIKDVFLKEGPQIYSIFTEHLQYKVCQQA